MWMPPVGSLNVHGVSYPLNEGIRVKESATPATETEWASVTKSGITATR